MRVPYKDRIRRLFLWAAWGFQAARYRTKR
jgi:hypothetical protein